MTPFSLNPPSPSPFPLLESKEDQFLQLFTSPPQQAASSPSCPILFKPAQDQRGSIPGESPHEHKVNKCILHDGSSDGREFRSSSIQHTIEDSNEGPKLCLWKQENGYENGNDHNGPVKWMSSNMRLMQKMMNSNCRTANKPAVRIMQKSHDQQQDNSEIKSSNNCNNTVRVCADCNTTKTPLWRSGPQGPKSLCNACGIRQRKARRAMAAAAAAANGTVVLGSGTSSVGIKVKTKERRSRKSDAEQFKKQCKLPSHDHGKKQLCFKDFTLSLSKSSAFRRVFPQDEEEAAILLMALSCGLVHS